MEDGLLEEVERDIRGYEAFLSQRKDSTSPISERPEATQGISASTDGPVETSNDASSFTTQLDRHISAQPRRSIPFDSSGGSRLRENEDSAGRSSIDAAERNPLVDSESSDEEELCQIFDELVSLRCPELTQSPDSTRKNSTPCLPDSNSPPAKRVPSPLSPQARSPLKVPPPQQEWFDFKRGQYKGSNRSGPEEIVSSTYSHVGGSSCSDLHPTPSSKSALTGTEGKLPNRHSKEAIQKSVEAEMKKEFTFHPKLISKQRPESKAIPQDRGARLEQLSRPKTPKVHPEHEAEREVREAADLAECYFQPRTGRPPENHTRHKPVEERLYHAHDSKNSAMARCMMEREKEILMECTFHPVTNRKKTKLKSYVPLPERAMEIQIAKRERLMSQLDEEATFAPAINTRSKRLAKLKEERQLREAVDSDGHCTIFSPNASPSKAAQERDRDCTYTPEINPVSKRLFERLNVPDDFVARQSFFDDLRKKKQEAMQAALDEEECTFAPKTEHNDELLAASRFAGRLFEDQDEFLERLAHKDSESREARKSVKEEAQMAVYTFRPEINAVSKLIGKNRTVEELYEVGKEKIRRDDAKRSNDPPAECTFKPSLKKPEPTYLRVRRSDPQTEKRLWERAQSKRHREALMRETRRENAERQEMKECTFTPNIKYCVPQSKARLYIYARGMDAEQVPVAIAGLGRYLECRQSAQRMKEDQRRREEQIFRTKSADAGAKFTIPVPFKLSHTLKKETCAESN